MSAARTWASIPELVADRASSAPALVGYRFLSRTGEEDRLDYRTLHERAMAVAVRLREHAKPGDRVVVVLPPGIDFIVAIFGCLYAGVVAVPSAVPHGGRAERRLDAVARIVADTEPAVVMTTPALQPALAAMKELRADVGWMTEFRACDAVHDPEAAAAGAPAVIQYSSGSTRAPRGVVLSQENLLANIAIIHQKFQTSRESRGVIWLPPHHDMGLIGGVLGPVYGGFPVILLSPVTFIHQPFRWLKAISDTRATISGGPDFAYRLCVERVSAEQRMLLDLSCWDVAFSGAEPVRSATLDRFAATFAAQGFRRRAFFPCYGLAEATLFVTGPDSGPDRAVKPSRRGARVDCGSPAPDHEVRIVHPESLRPCRPGVIGEIWVRGPSVAARYWNDAAETARTFGWTLNGQGPFLRTGDLGIVTGGRLHVTGRLKDVMLIGGQKYWPEDVEDSLAGLDADLVAGGCAAFTIEVDGHERLAIVHEVDRRAPPQRHAALVDAIRRRVAEHWALPVHDVRLLKPGGLPRTTSGKPRRFMCRDGFAASTLDVWAPAEAAV